MANQTLIEFCKHFTNENKEHPCKLTTAQLGYHSANITMAVAQLSLNSVPAAHSANAAIATSMTTLPAPMPRAPSGTPYAITDDGIHMFYCWTHGLGFNHTHTSATCANAADGHCKTATATNMMPRHEDEGSWPARMQPLN